MREVISSQLWIGNALDVRDLRLIHDAGVRAIVDLAIEEQSPQLTRDLIYLRVPLTDGSANTLQSLVTAIEAVAGLIRRQTPTLVACSAGMSRSPSIVAAALAIERGQTPDRVLEDITRGHPRDVSPRLWAKVLAAHDELTK